MTEQSTNVHATQQLATLLSTFRITKKKNAHCVLATYNINYICQCSFLCIMRSFMVCIPLHLLPGRSD